MPLDPSISLGAAPQQSNPLAMAGQAVELGNNLVKGQLLQNQNALFQLQTQSQLAIGNILAQHTNPETGEVDLKGAMAATSKSGPAAYGMQDILKKNVERQIQQLELTTKAIGMHSKIAETTANAFGPLLQKPGGGSDDDLKNTISQVWNVYSTDPMIMDSHREAIRKQLLTTFANPPPQGPGREEWVRSHWAQFQESKAQMDAQTPDRFEVDTGSTKDVYGIDKMSGKITRMVSAPKGLTPAEGAAPVTAPGGQPVPLRSTTLAPGQGTSLVSPTARGNALVGAQGNPLAGPTQDQTDAMTAGVAEDNALVGPRGTVPQAAPGQGATGPSGVPSLQGQPSGRIAPQTTVEAELQKPAIKYAEALDERVEAGGQMQKQLAEVIPLLSKINTGGLGEVKAKLAQIAQGIPGVSPDLVKRIANGDLAAAQEFDKFMVTYATTTMSRALAGNTGKFTQMEWAKFQEANPNLNTDPEAVRKIFNFATRMYQMDRKEQEALVEARKEPGFNITNWQNTWQKRMQKEGMINPQEIPEPKPAQKATTHEERLRQLFGARP